MTIFAWYYKNLTRNFVDLQQKHIRPQRPHVGQKMKSASFQILLNYFTSQMMYVMNIMTNQGIVYIDIICKVLNKF